jgi:FkbM family methyltransferase
MLGLWLQAATHTRLPIPALRLVVNGRPTAIRVSDESEFFGSYEVLSSGDYDIRCGDVRRVLDLGANVGFASILFAERYPAAEIVAVEAAPDTFARLDANVAGLPSVCALHLAVGSDDPVYIDLALPSAERQASRRGVVVPSKTLARLLDDLGWDQVDLMKIDIEGAEHAVFADPAMSRVRAIVGEMHGTGELRALLPGFDVDANPAIGSAATMFRAVRAAS